MNSGGVFVMSTLNTAPFSRPDISMLSPFLSFLMFLDSWNVEPADSSAI